MSSPKMFSKYNIINFARIYMFYVFDLTTNYFLLILLILFSINNIFFLACRKEANLSNMVLTGVYLRIIGNLSKTISMIFPCLSRFVVTDVINNAILTFEEKVHNIIIINLI